MFVNWFYIYREDKILLEARIEEVEEKKAAIEVKMSKKEEIFQEKLGKLKTRKGKGGKSNNVEQLESALAEAEEEKGSLQLRLVELEDIAGESVCSSNIHAFPFTVRLN